MHVRALGLHLQEGPVERAESVGHATNPARAGAQVAFLAEAVGIELAGASASQAHPEYEPAAAQAVERDRLARQPVRAPAPSPNGVTYTLAPTFDRHSGGMQVALRF